MNDNDIIKALKCCRGGKREYGCNKCPLYCRVPACTGHLTEAALDLINRQKAEIERLQKYNTDMARKHYNDGIRGFAERLKRDITINNTEDGCLIYSIDYGCLMEDIDNLVKEMTEGEGDTD